MKRSPDYFNIELLRQIVSTAACARSLAEYVDSLVLKLHDAMDVQVSSLYLVGSDARLKLIASVGLAPEVVGKLVLEAGEGLVGFVASARLPLNLLEAKSHPAFHYIPDSREDPSSAFLGAPIVYLDEVIGVLVAQDSRPGGFSEVEESLLVMIAAQLAGSLVQWRQNPNTSIPRLSQYIQAKGISGAPGIAIGRVHLVLSGSMLSVVNDPLPEDVDSELARLRTATQKTMAELKQARSRIGEAVDRDVLGLFNFYELVLQSDQLIGAAEARIRGGDSAFKAARQSIDEVRTIFLNMEDAYLRSRAEDLEHIGTKLLNYMAGGAFELAPDNESVVLLGELVSITDIAAMRPRQLAGVVTLGGSSLSHTAVLARALGVPAVMGVGHLEGVNEGDPVVVDGQVGLVFIRPSAAVLSAYTSLLREQIELQDQLAELTDLPALTPDGVRITLLVNTGLLADSLPGLSRGAEGVGLYRSEIPFLVSPDFPTEEEQYKTYREVLSAYCPLPVTMRILDAGGDKALPYFHTQEDNPALGWRGIRFALDNPDVLATQLRAMLRADVGLGNLKLMLPMVSRAREVEEIERRIRQLCAKMKQEGHAVRIPDLGIMIEIPAVITVLDRIAPLIDFVSIGTNDLTQYLLAVDRGNSRVTAHFDHLHPAVMEAIARVVRIADQFELDCTLCGEMAADPEAVPFLIGAGLKTLSMNAHSLPAIKQLIRQLPAWTARQLFEASMLLPDEASLRELLRQTCPVKPPPSRA